jgi:hypothetical protein
MACSAGLHWPYRLVSTKRVHTKRPIQVSQLYGDITFVHDHKRILQPACELALPENEARGASCKSKKTDEVCPGITKDKF